MCIDVDSSYSWAAGIQPTFMSMSVYICNHVVRLSLQTTGLFTYCHKQTYNMPQQTLFILEITTLVATSYLSNYLSVSK